jgi:uncharacterized protein YbjQ (UPF0145 family)
LAQSNILLATTKTIPNHKIVEYRGLVFGITVRSRGAFGDYCAQWQSCCGGEIEAYTSVLIDSRNEALNRMVADAQARGANAIVGIRVDKDQLNPSNRNSKYSWVNANNATIAIGTAVIVQKE